MGHGFIKIALAVSESHLLLEEGFNVVTASLSLSAKYKLIHLSDLMKMK